ARRRPVQRRGGRRDGEGGARDAQDDGPGGSRRPGSHVEPGAVQAGYLRRTSSRGATVADGDRQFLLSVFLMEAWDTLAAVEDGLAARGRAPGQAATLESLAIGAHRFPGS